MTMTNAEWILKEGIPFKNIKTIQHNPKETRWYEIAVNDKVVDKIVSKLEPADLFRKWLDSEHKSPILDDTERAYLSAVIKPFRDRVKHICKINYLGVSSSEYQYIFISLSDGSYNIDLPIFKRDTMYKGMKKGHDYTIEELGL